MSAFNKIFKKHFQLSIFAIVFLLNGCGGGGGGNPAATTLPAAKVINGAGVKGPMANAMVTAYEIDSSKVDLKGTVAGTGTTNAAAQIIGLTIPAAKTAPFILEFTSVAATTDITTGKPPVIATLRTVLTQALLTSGNVYASLQTTMATDIAIANADSNVAPYTGDNNATTTAQELLNALPIAAAQVMSTFGFGATTSVDIFTTAPLITATTLTDAEQKTVAEYRTAIEAMTALVNELATNTAYSNPAQTAEAMFAEITADLSDGVVDGNVNGAASTIVNAAVLAGITAIDPTTLLIPGSTKTVGEVETVLVNEKAITGSTTATTNLGNGTINVTPVPAVTNPDADNDTIADFIDNCPALANTDQSDTNNNGVGDICDDAPVANTDSITVNEGETITILANGGASVLTNDTDINLDKLTARITLAPASSSSFGFTNADGTFTYTHDGSETIADIFNYVANDGTSDSFPAVVGITIIPVNDNPTGVPDINSVTEDNVVNPITGSILGNDTDPDNNFGSFSVKNFAVLNNTGAYGILTIDATGNYSYLLDNTNSLVNALNTGQSLTEIYNYTIADGSGGTGTSTLTITIKGFTDPNGVPTANNDSISVLEGGLATVLVSGEISVLANDTDPENDTLTTKIITRTKNATGFNLVASDGTFRYAHNGSETITDTFTYVVNDGFSDSNVATVNITIIPVNDNPTGVNDTNAVTEDSIVDTVTGNVLTNDTDPDNLTSEFTVTNAVALTGSTLYGTFSLNVDGSYSYKLDNTNLKVDALNTNTSLVETFNYTFTDGVGGNGTGTLVVRIIGVTDTTTGIDISGVWQISSLVQSVTLGGANNCEIVGDADTSFATIKQTGTNLDIKTHLGASYMGTIDTTTGAISINNQVFTRKIADVSQASNDAAPLVDFTETVTVTGTAVSPTSITGGTISTVRRVGGISSEDCDYTETFTANLLYKHTGTEQYNGVYGDETSNESIYNNIQDGLSTDQYREAFTLQYEINGSTINLHLPGFNKLLPSSSSTFSNLIFDPLSGYFSGTLVLDLQIDSNDDSVVDFTFKSNRELTGIFIRPPSKNIDGSVISGGSEGTNGAPIVAVSLFGYSRGYIGDGSAGQFEVTIEVEDSYQKRLITEGFTRNALVEKGDKTLEDKIKIGILNPFLKKQSNTSRLYLEVLDSAQVELCSSPFLDEPNMSNHQYVLMTNLPAPNFSTQSFRSSVYGNINCSMIPAALTPTITNGTTVTIRIRDTGADGVKNGVDADTFTVIDANYTPKIFAPIFTQVVPLSNIRVNGVTVSPTNISGSPVPLKGYFDTSEQTIVEWDAHPEVPNSYQLRYEDPNDPRAIKFRTGRRLATGATTISATVQGFKLQGGFGGSSTLRVAAFKKTGKGPTVAQSQSFSRRIAVKDGIDGLFNINLGIGVIPEYRTMQLQLTKNADGSLSCAVQGNTSMSCGKLIRNDLSAPLDRVLLDMTDITGNLLGIANTNFDLELHFKYSGVITGGSAAVIAPNDINGITGIPTTLPVIPVIPTATATLVNQ